MHVNADEIPISARLKRPNQLCGRFRGMAPFDESPIASDEARSAFSIPHRPVLLQGRQVALFCGTQPMGSCEEHRHPWIQGTFFLESALCSVSHRQPSGKPCERMFSGQQVCCIPAHTSHIERWGGMSPLLEAYFAPQFVATLHQEDVMAVLVRESLDSAARDLVLWMLVSALRHLYAESPRSTLALLEGRGTRAGATTFSAWIHGVRFCGLWLTAWVGNVNVRPRAIKRVGKTQTTNADPI